MRVNGFSVVVGAVLFYTCSINGQVQDDTKGNKECICLPYQYCTDTGGEVDGDIQRANVTDIRGRKGDCIYYEHGWKRTGICCVLQGDPPTRPHPTPQSIPRRNSCGKRNFDGVDFRIKGNSDDKSKYGEFPWMVAVLREELIGSAPNGSSVYLKVFQCGGSIIHNQVILTAAHCIKENNVLTVRAGEWDTQTDKERYPIQERNVTQVIIHEDFYARRLRNDIALLVLDSPLQPSPVVSPICLPEQDENMDNRNCVVTGWGKDVFGMKGKYEVILKKVEVHVVPRDKCQEALRETRLGKHFKVNYSFICAGGEAGKDGCKGDGGGPLACPSKDNPEVYTQAGIVAWGIGCGGPIPAAYVNVPLFRDWIDNKLDSLGFR